MQRLEYDRKVKITTVNGTYSGPLIIRVSGDSSESQRDIDNGWVKVPSDTLDIDEISSRVDLWLSQEPPRDMDGRIIPVTLV